MADTLSIGERRLPVMSTDESDPAFFIDTEDFTPVASEDDAPLAILPNDEFDGLFAQLDGSVLDELLTV